MFPQPLCARPPPGLLPQKGTSPFCTWGKYASPSKRRRDIARVVDYQARHKITYHGMPVICDSFSGHLSCHDLIFNMKEAGVDTFAEVMPVCGAADHCTPAMKALTDALVLRPLLVDPKGEKVSIPAFGSRDRDALPIPPISWTQLSNLFLPSCGICSKVFLCWLNGCFFTINVLYGLGQNESTKTLSKCQQHIVVGIASKLDRMLSRCLGSGFNLSSSEAYATITGQLVDSASSTLVAESFDLLEHSGKVDPMPDLDEPIFMAGPKPMLTEFGIHYRLESCESTANLTE